ncbi:LOW QUALITY PROTEIN: cytochrome P450 18a1-like [Paramacrobiotus metropolitanus]|uniref:LOW QUALITY PROTEIN: cytochrome P450 18a1-like n=1 Tax=Paramacrobiotus metropolitanus TaxID=2943436 RepID=UPI0024460A59|nr:LOW QUALITY PROTEIN: cytochrome P450 18a1-like [Paramacrobiotus metropolitanus]
MAFHQEETGSHHVASPGLYLPSSCSNCPSAINVASFIVAGHYRRRHTVHFAVPADTMLVYFVNVAVFSAVAFYFIRSLKKKFQKEVDHFLTFFRDSKLPPGPWGVPGLGYLPFMAGKNPYTVFSTLADQYGGMAFVELGQKNILVISDPGILRETYKLAAFSARPNSKLKDDTMIGNKGIIQAVGDVWSEHRRLILTAFRTIGLKTAAPTSVTPQTSHINEIIHRDVHEYLKFINQLVVGRRDDGGVMLERLTGRLAGSCISSCVFGLTKKFDDADFAENVKIIEEGFQVGELIAPFEFLPLLRRIPVWWKKVENKMRKNHCFTCQYFSGMIAEKSEEKISHADSLITIYKEEMARKDSIAASHILSEPQLRQTMTDLFCAGTETVKYSLLWSFLYMAKYPEIQRAVQKEIDAVYSDKEQLADYDDIINMPFTEATILETMRLRPVLPMGHARATHEAYTSYRGHHIPPNTVVLSLIWDIHTNPKFWDNPDEFRPSRFINSEGKTFRPENFIPFGLGRRSCMGDQMAMKELFITFTSLLNRYTIVPTDGEEIDLGWRIMLSLLVPSKLPIALVPRV